MTHADDRRRVATRLAWLQVTAAAVFVVLAFSFWYLQVVEGKHYSELAENNHQRTLTRRAARGVLFDRNLEPLVDSRPSLLVSLGRERTKDLNSTIETLAQVAGLDPEQVRQAVERQGRKERYRSIPIIQDASVEQVARLRARRLELPDVFIETVPARKYPPGGLAAHLFGYVG